MLGETCPVCESNFFSCLKEKKNILLIKKKKAFQFSLSLLGKQTTIEINNKEHFYIHTLKSSHLFYLDIFKDSGKQN